ncbi:MAG: hypothetical protein JXR05_08445 [Flavobacteriaceae bacterium]
MHKKLTADLISLAHSILQMKNKDDVFALKQKAHEVYEKLSVLAYVEEYINNTPNPEHTKEELLEKIEDLAKEKKAKEEPAEEKIVKHDLEAPIEKVVESEVEKEVVEETSSEIELLVEEPTEVIEEKVEVAEELEEVIEETTNEVEIEVETEIEIEKEVEEKTPSLEEELKDTIAVDVVADLFENVPKKSLNDKLQGDIQIGLNDRIAFVKNLFGGSQEDFNRVVSQLNTLKTEKEAKKFINKMVKPDYDWANKEEFEERFMEIVERKFL